MCKYIHFNELNEAMNCKKSVKNNIVAGIGATMFVGSDRYAMVVTEVNGPKRIKVAHLMDEHEDKFVKDDNGLMILPDDLLEIYFRQNASDDWGRPISYYHSIEYTLRKNGRWMPKGSGMWETSSIHIGHAENYRDPSF